MKHTQRTTPFQVKLTTSTDEPVTEGEDVVIALHELGVEFDDFEAEDPDEGIWLVGLLGRHQLQALAGCHLWEVGGGFVLEVPQP